MKFLKKAATPINIAICKFEFTCYNILQGDIKSWRIAIENDISKKLLLIKTAYIDVALRAKNHFSSAVLVYSLRVPASLSNGTVMGPQVSRQIAAAC